MTSTVLNIADSIEMNVLSTPLSHSRSISQGKSISELSPGKRDYVVGIGLLLVVVFLWTASNFVTQVCEHPYCLEVELSVRTFRICLTEGTKSRSCTSSRYFRPAVSLSTGYVHQSYLSKYKRVFAVSPSILNTNALGPISRVQDKRRGQRGH